MKSRHRVILFALLAAMGSCRSSSETSDRGPVSRPPSRRGRILTGVEITSIRIIRMPLYAPNGEEWDPWAPLAGAPDVYVKLSQLGSAVYESEVTEDCAPGSEVACVRGLPLRVAAWTTEMRIEVFDEDGLTADDNMGYFTFRLDEDPKKGVLHLKSADGELEIELLTRALYE
jgi:hypothetical protein